MHAMFPVFQTSILGSSAATPTSERHTSAQLLMHHNKFFLLDCAEGTQMQLRRFRMPLMKVNHIFITHLHGDHYLGLPGLIFSYHLLGRKHDLHVYSPPGLEEIIGLHYRVSQLRPSYEVHFHEVGEHEQELYQDKQLSIKAIAMEHRIPTFGFLFSEKERERKIIKENIKKYRIPYQKMPMIKKGEDLELDNRQIVPNREITFDPPPPRSYAYCSDTHYTESFLGMIRSADLLYHEATFLHDKAEVAREKMHSTTVEAATLAKKAGVKQLLLGHYSARYKDMELFREEARAVFPQTLLAEEGMVVTVGPQPG